MPDQHDLPKGVDRFSPALMDDGEGAYMRKNNLNGVWVKTPDLPAIRAAAVAEERERGRQTLLRLAIWAEDQERYHDARAGYKGMHAERAFAFGQMKAKVHDIRAALNSDREGESGG